MRTLLIVLATLTCSSALADEPVKIVVEVSAGVDAGKKLVIHAGDAFQVGRSPESDLQLANDARVSRQHLKVSCDARRCQMEDLGSTNGTTLNGKPVKTAEVKPGDRLKLGDTQLVVRRP